MGGAGGLTPPLGLTAGEAIPAQAAASGSSEYNGRRGGAGDGNRTRTASLGIRHGPAIYAPVAGSDVPVSDLRCPWLVARGVHESHQRLVSRR